FSYFHTADTIYLEAHENYQKRSYRNRAHLVGANGLQRLSIPLKKGKNQQQTIQDVKIAYHESWHRQHWQSIISAYGNAPFFPFYADELAPIYEQQYDKLWDFNLSLLKLVFRLLQWDKAIQLTEGYHHSYAKETCDIRNTIRPNIATADKFPPYPQVFTERHGFSSNLSILDLLFCQGPQANLYLSQISL
ncbi:MAG: WbqC family protein, partial [Bacteroidota bacterium]